MTQGRWSAGARRPDLERRQAELEEIEMELRLDRFDLAQFVLDAYKQ